MVAFVWWLEGKPEFTAANLQRDLLDYYKGLNAQRRQNRKFTPDLDRVSVSWVSSHPGSFHDDTTFYNPAGELFPLHGEVSFQFCSGANHTAGVSILSPQASGAPIWKDLHAIRDSFHCSR